MAQILVPLHEITIFRILNDNIMAQKVSQKVERIRILGRQDSNPESSKNPQGFESGPESRFESACAIHMT